MARKKKVDFQKALTEKTVLEGLVRVCNRGYVDGNLREILCVDCGSDTVYIREPDAIPFPYSKSLTRLVGSTIKFTIKEIVEGTEGNPDEYYGDMKEAKEILAAPIIAQIESGEIMDGVVINATAHGAYIGVGEVKGLLKNTDFADDGSEVRDFYHRGSPIKVKFKKYSETGTLYFLPAKMRHGSSSIKRSDVAVGMVMYGKVVTTLPDRCFVNILPGVDCLCFTPKMGDLRNNDGVQVKIQRVYTDEETNKLMVRGKVLGKSPTNPYLIKQ